MWLGWTGPVLGSGGFTDTGVDGYCQSEQVYPRGLKAGQGLQHFGGDLWKVQTLGRGRILMVNN